MPSTVPGSSKAFGITISLACGGPGEGQLRLHSPAAALGNRPPRARRRDADVETLGLQIRTGRQRHVRPEVTLAPAWGQAELSWSYPCGPSRQHGGPAYLGTGH